MQKKVFDRPNLARDMKSNAILNINNNDYQAIKALRNRNYDTAKRLDTLEENVTAIKQMLEQLLNER